MTDYVILVDKNDRKLGQMEKIEAHQKALRHRAISVLVFNRQGQLMLQQRALSKYHCPGLWSNTCCTHPRPEETVEAAAHRRLQEEMGFDCSLKELFSFNYQVKLDHGLTEKEYDHVFIGHFDGQPKLNQEEAANYRWIDLDQLQEELIETPKIYTYWFREIAKTLFSQNSYIGLTLALF